MSSSRWILTGISWVTLVYVPEVVKLDKEPVSFAGYVEDVNTVTSEKLSGSMTSFTTSGTYTKVTQLIPVKIKLLDDINLADIIGTNATVKIRIK